MVPTWCNGVSFMDAGPDSGDRRVRRRAHSAPGRDATHPIVQQFFPREFTPSDVRRGQFWSFDETVEVPFKS